MSLFDEMERAFRDLARSPLSAAGIADFDWGPAVDVYETEGEVVVRANLAGAAKEDVEVNATDEAVTVHGETRQESEVREEGLYRREFRYGSFHRTIPWPTNVDSQSVSAKLEDGILTIRAQKTEKAMGGQKVSVE